MKPKNVLEHFGTKAEIARALGIEPPSVTDFFEKDAIPEGRQYQIQLITKGKLKALLPADRRKLKTA